MRLEQCPHTGSQYERQHSKTTVYSQNKDAVLIVEGLMSLTEHECTIGEPKIVYGHELLTVLIHG